MMPGLHAFGSCALASDTRANTTLVDGDATNPLRLYVSNVLRENELLMSSLRGSHTIGEQEECEFTLVNAGNPPTEGMAVRVMYFNDVLFSGTIREVELSHDPTQSVVQYRCRCVDWSELLARHVIRRNFQEAAPHNILTSLLDNELSGNGLSIGTIDTIVSLPLVDSQGGTALDVIRGMAEATGQTLMIDEDRKIHLVVTSAPDAPVALTANVVLSATISTSRDDYRNVQMVRVTGTPSDDSAEDERIVDVSMQSDDQIGERQAIEGTNGRYEVFDEITHPTSNNATLLQLLGHSYCTAKLAVAGQVKQVLKATLIGYGWKPGQAISATLTGLQVSGTWYAQRISYRTDIPRLLVYDIEASITSQRQRAWNAWLRIVDRGKIVIQLPGTAAPSAQSVVFSTAGSSNWTVPANVTSVTITALGASASGTGAWKFWTISRGTCFAAGTNGLKGGNGGQAIATVSVVPGDELNITVGAKGTPGGAFGHLGDASCHAGPAPGNGASSTSTTKVERLGVNLVEAYGGTRATAPSTPGGNGGGSGAIVTTGGGRVGGAGGQYHGNQTGSVGQDGQITIEYVVNP